MNRDFPFATLCGLIVGFYVYRFLIHEGFLSVGIAAIYTGAVYFYLEHNLSLLSSAIQFDDSMDQLGYAIGIFGICISPMAVSQYYINNGGKTLPLIILFIGVIAFLQFISESHYQSEKDN